MPVEHRKTTCHRCGERHYPTDDCSTERRSGGAGSRRQPTTDREYQQALADLLALNAADARDEE